MKINPFYIVVKETILQSFTLALVMFFIITLQRYE